MKKYLICILLLLVCVVLTSCVTNSTQLIADQLRPAELIEIFNTVPPNLAVRSKCPSIPSVRIVNAEINDQDYLVYTWWPSEVYVNPKKLMDNVVSYINDAFNRTGIKADQNSTNVIQVSMEKMKSWYGYNFNFSANTQLKIMLPEKKFIETYGYSDSTPKGPQMAITYTIHVITWKIITDPFVQDYILCR